MASTTGIDPGSVSFVQTGMEVRVPPGVPGPCPVILPVLRFALPNLGYPDPARPTGRSRARRTAAGPPGQQDRGAGGSLASRGGMSRVYEPDRRPPCGSCDLPWLAAGPHAGADAPGPAVSGVAQIRR